jgi:hypothetical protein
VGLLCSFVGSVLAPIFLISFLAVVLVVLALSACPWTTRRSIPPPPPQSFISTETIAPHVFVSI